MPVAAQLTPPRGKGTVSRVWWRFGFVMGVVVFGGAAGFLGGNAVQELWPRTCYPSQMDYHVVECARFHSQDIHWLLGAIGGIWFGWFWKTGRLSRFFRTVSGPR